MTMDKNAFLASYADDDNTETVAISGGRKVIVRGATHKESLELAAMKDDHARTIRGLARLIIDPVLSENKNPQQRLAEAERWVKEWQSVAPTDDIRAVAVAVARLSGMEVKSEQDAAKSVDE